MRGAAGISRRLLRGLSCLGLLSGCQSAPVSDAWIAPESSMLAVDVSFPEPFNRDPSLVQAWFLKGPVPGEAGELTELIPATFVKWSRAYLLDPEPGSYSVAAVAAEYAPPWNDQPIDGVTQTTSSGISSDAVIFPADLIRRTTTAVAPGQSAFAGLLQVRRGERISADALPSDALQRQIAERLRPGVTSQTGLRAWLARARMVDLANTSVHGAPADREAFLTAAHSDLAGSPWASLVPRQATPVKSPVRAAAAPSPKPAATSEPPVPRAMKTDGEVAAQKPVPIPELEAKAGPQPVATVVPPQTPVVEPQAAISEPQAAVTLPEATPAPAQSEVARLEPLAPIPEPEPFPSIPSDSPLVQIRRGMKHDEVLRILGSPDERIDRLTAQAWIPFHDSRGDTLREWIYTGKGRVVFSLYQGSLEVVDAVYDPEQRTSWGVR